MTNEFSESLQKSLDDPVYFAKAFLNFDVFDYNQKFVRDQSDFIVRRAGRKAGKSQNVSIKVLHYAFFAPYLLEGVREKGRCGILITAPTKELAAIIFEDVRRLATNTFLMNWKGDVETKTQLQIMFCDRKGMTDIFIRAAGRDGKSLRGYEANVLVIDEAAFVPDVVFDAVYFNVIAVDGKTILTSTPFGKSGFFYENSRNTIAGNANVEEEYIDKEGKATIVQYLNTSYDNPKVARNRQSLDEILSGRSQAVIDTEIYAKFLDVGDGLFSYSSLMDVWGDIDFGKIKEKLILDIGVDVARAGIDDTVVTTTAIGLKTGRAWVVRHKRGAKTTIGDTATMAMTEFDYWKGRGCSMGMIIVDDTGMGGGVADDLNKYHYPVRKFTFEKRSKVDLYDSLNVLVEKKRIMIGSERKLLHQLLELRKEFYDLGVKIVTPAGHNDDYADSLALSVFRLQRANRITLLTKHGKMVNLDELMSDG